MKLIAIYSLVLVGLSASVQADTKPAPKPAPKRIEITVTPRGFMPDRIEVPAGVPVVLAVTRTTDRTCAKRVIVQLGDGKQVEQDLPLDKVVEVPITFPKKGELRYACAMDMVTGVIVVQ